MSDHPAHVPPRPRDEIHVPFIVASLLFGALGGFTLAVSLPIEGIIGSVSVSWVAHAQVHGHLQVVGFAGLFVVGMAFRFAPRFGGRPSMSPPGAERWVLWLLVVGLAARAVGQPLAGSAPFGGVAAAGAASEFAGAALFMVMLCFTLSDALRARQPHAILLVGAGAGLTAQAALGAWWLTQVVRDGGELLPATQDRVLLHLQLFGVLLPAILGVGVRSFPTFFGRRPPGGAAGGAIAGFALIGVAIWTVGGVLASGGRDAWILSDLGQTSTGLAILTAIGVFGPWRRASRLAAASKGLASSIHPAVLWLGLTGGLLAFTAAQAALHSRIPETTTLDAVRHVFAIGVVTLAIVGMAQLILPEFASERLVGAPGRWRGPFFGTTLTVAAFLRGVVLLAGLEGEARWWAMAAAGILGWLAIAVFSALFWRASRRHRSYLQRIERFRRNGLPITQPEMPSETS